VKLSVSLPDDDVTYIDARVARQGAPSRSAVLHEAIRLLRRAEREREYAAAYAEWADDPDSALWETTAGDGLVS